MSSLINKVRTYAENAPKSGFVNMNFGKLVVTPIVSKWATDPETGIRSQTRKPYTEDYELGDGETLELQFKVIISELNPSLTFEYERTVAMLDSGSQQSDWAEIVLPSLERVFGKQKWADVIFNSPYVAVEDTPNIAKKANKNGKIYTVPKFIAMYANLDECKKARDIRYPKRSEGSSDTTPEDFFMPTDDAIAQAKSLIDSVGSDQALILLKDFPFGKYDADTLHDLASKK